MVCPFFVSENHECDLTASGIFLPSPRHLLAFCTSRFYHECKHFQKGAPIHERVQQTGLQSQAPSVAGRRRFARFDGEYQVLLVEPEGLGRDTAADSLDEEAVAVNYGQGGIRVQSRKRLPEDTPLFFRFAKDFIVPELRGLAQVCWQTKDRSEQQWVAGIAFSEASVGALIALQVEM